MGGLNPLPRRPRGHFPLSPKATGARGWGYWRSTTVCTQYTFSHRTRAYLQRFPFRSRQKTTIDCDPGDAGASTQLSTGTGGSAPGISPARRPGVPPPIYREALLNRESMLRLLLGGSLLMAPLLIGQHKSPAAVISGMGVERWNESMSAACQRKGHEGRERSTPTSREKPLLVFRRFSKM